jgi:hypothetical protein
MLLEFIFDLRDKMQVYQQESMNDHSLDVHVIHSNKVKAIQECLEMLIKVDKILHEINEHPDEIKEEDNFINYSDLD